MFYVPCCNRTHWAVRCIEGKNSSLLTVQALNIFLLLNLNYSSFKHYYLLHCILDSLKLAKTLPTSPHINSLRFLSQWQDPHNKNWGCLNPLSVVVFIKVIWLWTPRKSVAMRGQEIFAFTDSWSTFLKMHKKIIFSHVF